MQRAEFPEDVTHESVAAAGDPYSCQISTIYVPAGTAGPRTLAAAMRRRRIGRKGKKPKTRETKYGRIIVD